MSWVKYRGNKYWLNRKISSAGQKAFDVLAEDPDASPNKIIARTFQLLGCKTVLEIENHWASVETILRDVRELKRLSIHKCKSLVEDNKEVLF